MIWVLCNMGVAGLAAWQPEETRGGGKTGVNRLTREVKKTRDSLKKWIQRAVGGGHTTG